MDASSPRVTSSTKDAEGTLVFRLLKSYNCCSQFPVGRVHEEGAASCAEPDAWQKLGLGGEHVLARGAYAVQLPHPLGVQVHLHALPG